MTKAVELAQVASTGVSEAFKNRLINGQMVIAQRSTGPVNNAVSAATLTYDAIDRFGYWAQNSGVFSIQQSSVAPAGFRNSVLITSLANTSIISGAYYLYAQRVEGFNAADLDWGTANAKTVTFSFWVRSSLTGTFNGYIFNNGYSYNYPFTYTISAANTWEQKSVTIPGPTAGTWVGSTNGNALEIGLTLGLGSNWQGTANTWAAGNFIAGSSGTVNLVATSGATLHTTGWQLEVGSSATSFEYRSIGTELGLCQRYFLLLAPIHYFPGKQNGSTDWVGTLTVPVPLRASPTLSFSGGSTKYLFTTSGANLSTTNSITLVDFRNTYVSVALTGFSGLSDNVVGNVRFDNNVLISSEL